MADDFDTAMQKIVQREHDTKEKDRRLQEQRQAEIRDAMLLKQEVKTQWNDLKDKFETLIEKFNDKLSQTDMRLEFDHTDGSSDLIGALRVGIVRKGMASNFQKIDYKIFSNGKVLPDPNLPGRDTSLLLQEFNITESDITVWEQKIIEFLQKAH